MLDLPCPSRGTAQNPQAFRRKPATHSDIEAAINLVRIPMISAGYSEAMSATD